MCLHLLVLGFLRTFGYEWQQQDIDNRVDDAVKALDHNRAVGRAFLAGIPQVGLSEQKDMKKIIERLESQFASFAPPIVLVGSGNWGPVLDEVTPQVRKVLSELDGVG